MPVRKTAAKKTATPAKKSATKKPAATSSDAPTTAEKATAQKIIDAIQNGHFDPYLTQFDNALTDRINAYVAQQAAAKKKSASAAPAEKKVSPPPKKPTVTITPEEGVTYKVSSRVKNLAGTKVKFIRFKADSDGAKSVVELLTGVPGSPKGKRVVIPTAALEESGDTKKKPVRKKK